MLKFEILCVTMHQTDFSKIKEMNIHSDVVFANQADRTEFAELEFEGHTARMITTDTRGVGINRNLGLMYARGDICLFADDDMTYYDGLEQKIRAEFAAHPDADIIIFNVDSTGKRIPQKYSKTQKISRFSPKTWGTYRIAFRLSSAKKANLWFTTLYGGGCIFPSGEDSMWVTEARRRGLCIYVSKETIGTVSHATSTWFTGYDEKYYFGKGAFYQAMHPGTIWLWMVYFLLRTRGYGDMALAEKVRWIQHGRRGYRVMKGYADIKRDISSAVEK